MSNCHHGNLGITALCLALVCGSGAVSDNVFEATFCTRQNVEKAAQCFESGFVVQVIDVMCYHDADTESQAHRVCRHDPKDPGEPLLRISPVEYNYVVVSCDGRQGCSELNVNTLYLANNQQCDYVWMNYTCVEGSRVERIDIDVGVNLDMCVCAENSTIHISRALFAFPEGKCKARHDHVSINDLSALQAKCNNKPKCDSSAVPRGYNNCSGEDIGSTHIRIYYICNIKSGTATVRTTDGSTILSVFTSFLETTAAPTTAQARTAVTRATRIGLYAGLPVACLVVMLVFGSVLTRSRISKLISRKRLRQPRSTRQRQEATGITHSPVEEEYCEVGPALFSSNPDQTILTPGRGAPRGNTTAYTMVQPRSNNCEPDELEIVDNSLYEATPSRTDGAQSINRASPGSLEGQNSLNGGNILSPSASGQQSSDGAEHEDILVDNVNYSAWGN